LPDSVVDEYTLCQNLGSSANDTLQSHWDSWITESDFQSIAAAGMNFVRIPLGYWSVQLLPGDPYMQGAYSRLATALDWAQSAGLKVMIDLHGAPGSQNGFDNSGRKGDIGWGQGDTVSQTTTILNQIRDDHAAHPAVAAIELVNEPMASSVGEDTLKQFYQDGWGNLENSNVAITFHEGFLGVDAWQGWGSGMWNLLEDTHHYEIFNTGQLQMSASDHISSACSFGQQMTQSGFWTISGEWTGAATDCAKWLNGRGVGARYDGTYPGSSPIGDCDRKYSGTVDGLNDAEKSNIKNFINAQMDAYEKANGWIFWTWKTEGAPEWDMQALLAAGLFPNPVSSRTGESYPPDHT